MTLRCMQALVRVQARVRDQRVRLSQEGGCGGSNISSFSCDTAMLENRYLQDLSERKSMQSRDGSSVADDCDNRSRSLEGIQAMLQCRHDAALKRERAFAYAFSTQAWRSERNHPSSSMSIGDEREVEGGEELDQRPPKWLDRWIASRPSWDHNPNIVNSSSGNYRGRRASTDQRDPIKTLEIDTGRPFSYTSTPSTTTNFRRHHHHPNSPHHSLHRSHLQHSPATPMTPSPSKMRPLQVRSASPRCGREDRLLHSSVHSPSSHYSYQSTASTTGLRLHYQQVQHQLQYQQQHPVQPIPVPNYMAATESAKARVRSQSAPRQRSSTPERDRSSVGLAKKRLSFPAPDPYDGGGGSVAGSGVGYCSQQEHRGSNMKNLVNGGRFASEQRSNVSSSCTDSFGGEVSPSSTTDLRRWLR